MDTTTTCNHGFWLTDCPLCLKWPGECDYGSCTEPATTRVETRNTIGRVVERRPMCDHHACHAEQVSARDPFANDPDRTTRHHVASVPPGGQR